MANWNDHDDDDFGGNDRGFDDESRYGRGNSSFQPQGNFGYEGEGYMGAGRPNRSAYEGGEGYEDVSRRPFDEDRNRGYGSNDDSSYGRESFGGGAFRGMSDYSESSGNFGGVGSAGVGRNNFGGRGSSSGYGANRGMSGGYGEGRNLNRGYEAGANDLSGGIGGRNSYRGDSSGPFGNTRYDNRSDFGGSLGRSDRDMGAYTNIGGSTANNYDNRTGRGSVSGSGEGFFGGGLSGIDTSHRGKGPKGYQRSDERIREDVCDRLEQDHHIDASDIDVRVAGGVVTLTGTVNHRQMKRLAEDLVESIQGVKDVENQIRVSRERGTEASSTSASAGSTANENANSASGSGTGRGASSATSEGRTKRS